MRIIKELIPYAIIVLVVVLIRTFIATPVIACLKILFEFIYERKAILKKLKI